jgi:thiol-disulfide isomerase/thioredoxin
MNSRIRFRGLVLVALVAALLVVACTDASVVGPSVPGSSVARPSTVTPAATIPSAVPSAPSAATTAAPTATPSKGPAGTFLYDPTADARAEVVAAIAAAKADGKRVLIDYGADWCPDCHSLAAVLDSPAGLALLDASFHVVRVDVGYWDHNIDVATDYGNAIALGIPSVVVLDGAGTIIGSTADGSLASASAMTADEMLAILSHWAG